MDRIDLGNHPPGPEVANNSGSFFQGLQLAISPLEHDCD